MVTPLCGISIPVGNLVAFIMSGFMFKGIKQADSEEVFHLVDRMIWFQNIWITLITVPYFILLRDKPTTLPEQPISAQEKAKNSQFGQKIKLALQNKNYVYLSTAYALMIGMNTAFGISVDPIFSPLGFNNSDIAILGVCVVFAGVLASMTSGVLLKVF